MPSIVEAVRSYVTLGEIADVLRSRFDEYRPQSPSEISPRTVYSGEATTIGIRSDEHALLRTS